MAIDRDSVRAATTTTLPANTRTGNTLTADAPGALGAIDGITLTVDSRNPSITALGSPPVRILVKNESLGENNGIYELINAGSGAAHWVMRRAFDSSASGDYVTGMQVYVTAGTVNADTHWRLTTAQPITLNTTALTFGLVGLGSGSVAGPASATDNAIARFDGTTGRLIQNSVVTISDIGLLRITDNGVTVSLNITNGTHGYVGTASAHDFVILTTDTERIRINATTGNTHAVSLGTVSLPALGIGADTDTGFYSIGANSLSVAANGILRQTWNATGIGFFDAAPVVQQTETEPLTNSLAYIDGTVGTVPDWTDRTVFANSAVAIHQGMTQLARKLAQHDVAMRNYGLLIN